MIQSTKTHQKMFEMKGFLTKKCHWNYLLLVNSIKTDIYSKLMEIAELLSRYCVHGKPLVCFSTTLPCTVDFKKKHLLDQKVLCERNQLGLYLQRLNLLFGFS